MAQQPFVNELKEKVIQTKKEIFGFVSLLFVACILVSCAHFFSESRFIVTMQLCCFLLLGLAYATIVQKKLAIIDAKEAFTSSLSLAVSILFTLGIFYFFTGSLQLVKIISFSCTFLLPCIIIEAWRSYNKIPTLYKHLWFYSKEIPPEPIFVYVDNKPLRFKVIKEACRPKMVSCMAPVSLKLGMVFYYSLKEGNEFKKTTSLFMNATGEPYGWAFYISKYGLFKKWLQPGDTLSESKVRSNTMIVAKRIE
jgi:hypothetical protein